MRLAMRSRPGELTTTTYGRTVLWAAVHRASTLGTSQPRWAELIRSRNLGSRSVSPSSDGGAAGGAYLPWSVRGGLRGGSVPVDQRDPPRRCAPPTGCPCRARRGRDDTDD